MVAVLATGLYLSDLLVSGLGLLGALLAELAFVLVPALGLCVAEPAPLRQTLRLFPPRPLALAAALAAGPAAAVLSGALVQLHLRLWPLALEAEQRARALEAAARSSPLLALLALALIPALAEEAMFRGWLLGRLEQGLSPRAALWISALLFALFHRSLVRLAPQLMVGVLLGRTLQRGRSLWLPIALHLAYNLCILTWPRRLDEWALSPALVALSAGVVMAAVGLFPRPLPGRA